MKRTHLLAVLVTILMVAGLLGAALSSTTIKLWIGNASMSVNGVQQPIDTQGTKPVIVEGRTLVPIRAIIEAFGGSATWESSTRKVTVTLGKDSLDLWIDKPQASLTASPLRSMQQTLRLCLSSRMGGRCSRSGLSRNRLVSTFNTTR